jgi:hypothetical protein
VFEGFHDLPVFVGGRAQTLQIDGAPRIALDVPVADGLEVALLAFVLRQDRERLNIPFKKQSAPPNKNNTRRRGGQNDCCPRARGGAPYHMHFDDRGRLGADLSESSRHHDCGIPARWR